MPESKSDAPRDEQPPIVYRYDTKAGKRFYGVPARDLTEADVATLTPDLLREITAPGPDGQPAYVPVSPKVARAIVKQMVDEVPQAPPPDESSRTAAKRETGKEAKERWP